jgi:hypothetical protein
MEARTQPTTVRYFHCFVKTTYKNAYNYKKRVSTESCIGNVCAGIFVPIYKNRTTWLRITEASSLIRHCLHPSFTLLQFSVILCSAFTTRFPVPPFEITSVHSRPHYIIRTGINEINHDKLVMQCMHKDPYRFNIPKNVKSLSGTYEPRVQSTDHDLIPTMNASLAAMQGSAIGNNVRYYPTWKHSPFKERNEQGCYNA